MNLYEIKADPNLPHHYFIAVGIHPMTSKSMGEMYLKYRPIYINHSDIEKFRNVMMLTQDKLFPTSYTDALKMYDLQELANTFSMFKLAAKTNVCTIHHFSSEYEIDKKWFETFVGLANTNKDTKKKLIEAITK